MAEISGDYFKDYEISFNDNQLLLDDGNINQDDKSLQVQALSSLDKNPIQKTRNQVYPSKIKEIFNTYPHCYC